MQSLLPGKQILGIQPIPHHMFVAALVDQSKKRPRESRRLPPEQATIKHLRLRQIRQFRGTANVSRSREEIILHHRSQQSVRRKVHTARGEFLGCELQMRSRETAV